MANLVFLAGISVGGTIANISFEFREHKGWLGLYPLGRAATSSTAAHANKATKACNEINGLLHAGIPLEALAAAARLSRSNHAEILKCAAEAATKQRGSLESFGQ